MPSVVGVGQEWGEWLKMSLERRAETKSKSCRSLDYTLRAVKSFHPRLWLELVYTFKGLMFSALWETEWLGSTIAVVEMGDHGG